MNLQTLRRTLAVFACALTVPFLGAGTASAAHTHYFKIAPALSKSDFGTGTHQWGAPTKNGSLTWSGSSSVTATLVGNVYLDNLFGGGCARVRMTYYYSNNGTISTTTKYSNAVCRNSGWFGDVPSGGVNLSATASKGYKVVVTTQYRPTTSLSWTATGSRAIYR